MILFFQSTFTLDWYTVLNEFFLYKSLFKKITSMREGLTIPHCNVPVLWINDARIKRRFCIWKRGEPPSIYFFNASYFLKFLFRTKNQTLVKVNMKNNIQKRNTIPYSPLPCFEKQTLCISYWHLYNWISIFPVTTIYCIRNNY